MAEELVKTGNGVGVPHDPAKKTVRKHPKKVEENKMDPMQAPQDVIVPAIEKSEPAPVDVQAPVEEAPAAAPEATADVPPVVEPARPKADSRHFVPPQRIRDLGAQVEKFPGSKQVREVVTKVADQVGNNEVTQKAVRRVRDTVREASDQVKQGAQDLEKNPLVVVAHKVLLASVGAAALAQEEIEDFVNRLIERGSIAEADGRRMVKDVLDQRRKQMERASERAQEVATEMRSNLAEGPKRLADDLEQRIEGVLSRMNIPTKEEIETLTSKITALTHKVDELKKTE